MSGQGISNEGQEEEASQGQAVGLQGGSGVDGSREMNLRNEGGDTGRHCGVRFSGFRWLQIYFRFISDWWSEKSLKLEISYWFRLVYIG